MKLFSTTLLLAGSLTPALTPALPAQAHSAHPTQFQIDNRVEAEVQQSLRKPVFAGMSVLSSVNKGVVTLSGNATSEAAKELASSEVGNIEGVKTVLNNLSVTGSLTPRSTPAPVPAPALASGPKTITLPASTLLFVRLTDEIDTKSAKAGNIFHGTTAGTVSSGGYALIPSGTEVTGRIVDAKTAGHFSGAAELALELVSAKLYMPGGFHDVSIVTRQWSNKAAGRGANTAEKTGGGAAAGAIIGALAGGGGGAAIGAGTGGGLGAGLNAITRGKEIDLKSEQLLQFRTAAPLDVTILLRNGKQAAPETTGTPTQEQP